MSIGIKHVHIGREIDKRRLELGISKSELGRRIHVPQIGRASCRERV